MNEKKEEREIWGKKRATLEEKLIATCGWDMAQEVRDILADHFQIDKMEIDVGNIKLKSDNSPKNTVIIVGDNVLPNVSSIYWQMFGGERGRLTLNFV